MISVITQNTFRFILLLLLQVLILNNIRLGGMINPYLYVLVILSLPIDIPRWLVMLIGFVLGLSVDLFTHTPGMHLTASIFLGYTRPILLRYIAPREGYDFSATASIRDMGLGWYLSYASILIFLHHTFLFFVESFTTTALWYTLGKVFISSIFTLVLVLIFQYLGYQKKESE